MAPGRGLGRTDCHAVSIFVRTSLTDSEIEDARSRSSSRPFSRRRSVFRYARFDRSHPLKKRPAWRMMKPL